MTWSDERGYHSHGAVRVEYYAERIAKGGITADPKFEWKETGPCSGVFEGDNGCGYAVAKYGMDKAIEMAKKNGIAVVGMRNMSHSGSIGYYTEMAAEQGLLAISFCQSDPMAVPVGGTEPYYGTNPISFAAPTADERMVVFDMATTVQAWGKILDKRSRHESIPDSWAVDEKGKPIPGTEEDYTCDTLLLSVGLIPENELSGSMGVEMNRVTSGPVVNESLETNIEGVFACGNVLHVHDLVDFVSEEAAAAGKNAAKYVMDGERARGGQEIVLKAVDGVRYTVPCTVHPEQMEDTQIVRFRVGNVYKNCYIGVYFDDERVMHRKRPVMAPGEMEEIKLEKDKLLLHPELKTITIKVEEA